MTDRFDIAVFAGDGIGEEITAPCLALLELACERTGGVALDFTALPAGARAWRDTGEALPAASMARARASDAILLAAMGDPSIRYPDGTEVRPQLDLRFALGLYAGVRPIRSIPGVPGPLADPRAAGLDCVLLRESTEGMFAPQAPGTRIGDVEARETMVVTRAVTEKLTAFACRLAASRERDRARATHPMNVPVRAPGAKLAAARGEPAWSEDAFMARPARVTCIDKANVFGAFAFFREVFDEVCTEFGARHDHAYVDIMALNLVTRPWEYDVMVTENLLGDILSDLGAALVGGMGYAPSADIGDSTAVFQPCHGSAPDIAGKGLANPTAMFLSGAMMLDWLGERHGSAPAREAAARLRGAVDAAFADGGLVTVERGGDAGTRAVTDAVRAHLEAP